MDSSIAYWLAGIGTILLALITFYLEVMKPRLQNPKFSIQCGKKEPYRRISLTEKDIRKGVTAGVKEPINGYFVRIRVENCGKSVARRCKGKLEKVMNEKEELLVQYDPMTLHWVETDPRELPLSTIDLAPGQGEFLDVIYTLNGQQLAWIYSDILLRGMPKSFEQGKYILEITIYADNATPRSEKFKLIWGGANFTNISLEKYQDIKK